MDRGFEKNKTASQRKIVLYVILFVLVTVSFFSCRRDQKDSSKVESSDSINRSDELKRKELELKEKELELKEKELNERNVGRNNNLPGRYPQASERYLTTNDVIHLSKYELKIMRNEIYARHGYIFQTDDMREYFSRQNWYAPKYYDVSHFLTKIEKKNIELITEYEK